MIQCINQAEKKNQQSIFVLLTPKWSKIKDLKEVEEILSKCTTSSVNNLISNGVNKPLARSSSIAQKVVADTSDNELVQGSVNKDNEFDNSITNELFDLLFSDTKTNS